jgi:hypothetical protein
LTIQDPHEGLRNAWFDKKIGEAKKLSLVKLVHQPNAFIALTQYNIVIPREIVRIVGFACFQNIAFELGSSLCALRNKFNSEFIAAVSLQKNLRVIGSFTFQHSLLRCIFVPALVINIESSAFNECSTLILVSFEEHSKLCQISSKTFFSCESLAFVNIEKTEILSINEHAFFSCKSLCQMIIPASVQIINDSAFALCYNLVLVVVSVNSSLVKIGNTAFSCCTSLQKINFLESSRTKNLEICLQAFSDCKSLCEVIFSGNEISIDSYAFDECMNLALAKFDCTQNRITLSCSVFNNCGSLISATCRDGVDLKSVYPSAFSDCPNLPGA